VTIYTARKITGGIIDIFKNVANSISLKKYEAIKIIFIRVDSLTRKTFGLEIILGRGLMVWKKI